jgi:RNA polymerase sigma-54 factor
MKQSLRLNVSQHLILTPQLQQAIRLLQLSTLDLKLQIQNQIDSNPMLEVTLNNEPDEQQPENSATTNEEFTDFQWSHLYTHQNKNQQFNEDNYNYENLHSTSISLQDHLRWQLELALMSNIDKAIGTAIIDAIDDDGFLTFSIAGLHNDLNSKILPLDLAEIEAVRHRIQHFDPEGCGASNLAEELLFQLGQLPPETPYLPLAKKIISGHMCLLGKHSYQQLMKIYLIDEITLDKVLRLIQRLNPKPGSLIDHSKPEHTTPDLFVKKIDGYWRVELNPNALPHVSINNYYASLIQREKNGSDSQFLKNNLQEARWFLKSIKSRQETLLKVARYIVDYQKEFLEFGEEAMKPLILNDIAHALNMHESTISRATTQKFLHTPRGLFELKYFFSSHVSTRIGGECSSTAIRAFIKKLVSSENQNKPLSDSKLAELINEQGIKIARRTVAKYREAMSIAPSSTRKSIGIKTT